MNYFSDLEGLRIAIDIEKNGFEFYQKAYERTSNLEHKLLLGFLMQEESNHAAQFQAIYEKLKQNKTASDGEYLYDAEVSRYLQVLVEALIFPQNNPFADNPELANGVLESGWQRQTPGENATDKVSLSTILRIALQAEKDSILFYDEMVKNARFPEAKQIFATFKAEEQGHVEKIQAMIRTF